MDRVRIRSLPVTASASTTSASTRTMRTNTRTSSRHFKARTFAQNKKRKSSYLKLSFRHSGANPIKLFFTRKHLILNQKFKVATIVFICYQHSSLTVKRKLWSSCRVLGSRSEGCGFNSPSNARRKWCQSHARLVIAGAWSTSLMLQMIDNQLCV